MRTLFIVAHMDDEVLSCGGLLARRVQENGPQSVMVLVAFGRKYPNLLGEELNSVLRQQKRDFQAAQKILGYGHYQLLEKEEGEPGKVGYYSLLEKIEATLQEFDPDEVVIPSGNDLNQDHRHLHDVCKIALRPANLGRVSRILVAHGVDGTPPQANWFLPMGMMEFDLLVRAYGEYSTEVRQGAHPRSVKNLQARYRVQGSACGVEFAESYTLLLEKRG